MTFKKGAPVMGFFHGVESGFFGLNMSSLPALLLLTI